MSTWPKHKHTGWHRIRVREDETVQQALRRYFKARSVVLFDHYALVDGAFKPFDRATQAVLESLEDERGSCYIPESFEIRVQS